MLHRSTPSRHMSLVVVRLLLSTHSLSLSLPLRLVWFVGTFSGTAENELKIVLFRWRERENKRLLVTSDLILLFIAFLPCSLSPFLLHNGTRHSGKHAVRSNCANQTMIDAPYPGKSGESERDRERE